MDAALGAGYRLFDTAKYYYNEAQLGEALEVSFSFSLLPTRSRWSEALNEVTYIGNCSKSNLALFYLRSTCRSTA